MIMLPELSLSDFYDVGDYRDLDKYSSGLYFFYSDDSELMYIGNSEHLLSRIKSHINGNGHTDDIKHNFKKYRFSILEDPVDRDIYETRYINLWKPILNTAKVFTYQTKRYEEDYNPIYAAQKKNTDELVAEFVSNHMNLNLC